MATQKVLIGLGGTGSRVVNLVAARLKKRGIPYNDGRISCVVVDTNDNDAKKVRKQGNVPVVTTSDKLTVGELRKHYAYKGVNAWLPSSPSLNVETISDGAAQMRPKSRLAFAHTLWTRNIDLLKNELDKLFRAEPIDNKIRVMVVSSFAGGTGSGMFIQTALWLRKYFAEHTCQATIRGIFLMADCFTTTVENIKNDPTQIESMNANSYGALRELNAITKVTYKGLKLDHKMQISDLFDSERDRNNGLRPFDFSFFIDDIAANGTNHEKLEEYESLAANMVYMQLFAPMSDDLYSEEDNLFRRFSGSSEPVFGSCGTARAVYPTDNILRYCALRATDDAVGKSWTKIDSDIERRKKQISDLAKKGVSTKKQIDPRQEYIRMFDELTSRKGVEVGSDRLFVSIANDVNRIMTGSAENGEVTVEYIPAIDVFRDDLENMINNEVAKQDPGGLKKFKLPGNWGTSTVEEKDHWKRLVNRKIAENKKSIEDIEKEADSIAFQLLDRVFSTDMGEVDRSNGISIFGLLANKDIDERIYFIHPLAARYLLYKLNDVLSEMISVDTDGARNAAINGYGLGKGRISFDNKHSRAEEMSALELLDSHVFLHSDKNIVKFFLKQYKQFNDQQTQLTNRYAILLVQKKFAQLMSERLSKLIEQYEFFFKKLANARSLMDQMIKENVKETSVSIENVYYVGASETDKKAIYEKVAAGIDGTEAEENSLREVNGIIANSVYGRFCYMENPEDPDNKEFKSQSLYKLFVDNSVEAYASAIRKEADGEYDLDIVQAVYRSSDNEEAAMRAEILKNDPKAELEDEDDDTADYRRSNALSRLISLLREKSSVMIVSDPEQPVETDENLVESRNENGEVTYRTDAFDVAARPIRHYKVFWGANRYVLIDNPLLQQLTNLSMNGQQDAAYARNELSCYRAVYGIWAKYLPKFNELGKGKYYTSYEAVVNRMNKAVSAGDLSALVNTPHLDKTWHLHLPFVTPEMDGKAELKFFKLFWLAVAYGMISIDNKGNYQIKRYTDLKAGKSSKTETLKIGNKPIAKADVLSLVNSLLVDTKFAADAEKELIPKYMRDCAALNYVTTELFGGRKVKKVEDKKFDVEAFADITGETEEEITEKIESKIAVKPDQKPAAAKAKGTTVGGLAVSGDLNAVTLIVRYARSVQSDPETAANLVLSLERVLRGLVTDRYNADRAEDVDSVVYGLCKKIYQTSALKNKELDQFSKWKEAWEA